MKNKIKSLSYALVAIVVLVESGVMHGSSFFSRLRPAYQSMRSRISPLQQQMMRRSFSTTMQPRWGQSPLRRPFGGRVSTAPSYEPYRAATRAFSQGVPSENFYGKQKSRVVTGLHRQTFAQLDTKKREEIENGLNSESERLKKFDLITEKLDRKLNKLNDIVEGLSEEKLVAPDSLEKGSEPWTELAKAGLLMRQLKVHFSTEGRMNVSTGIFPRMKKTFGKTLMKDLTERYYFLNDWRSLYRRASLDNSWWDQMKNWWWVQQQKEKDPLLSHMEDLDKDYRSIYNKLERVEKKYQMARDVINNLSQQLEEKLGEDDNPLSPENVKWVDSQLDLMESLKIDPRPTPGLPKWTHEPVYKWLEIDSSLSHYLWD